MAVYCRMQLSFRIYQHVLHLIYPDIFTLSKLTCSKCLKWVGVDTFLDYVYKGKQQYVVKNGENGG